MRKLLVAGLLAAGLLSAAPDCSQVYHFSTRTSDQADGVVTFTAVGATPGVNNKLFGCSAWIMNVDVEGLSGSSVTLQSAPQGGPNFAGTYVTFAGTLSSGSNPTTTTTSSTSLFTGYFPWLRVNVGTMTGTGSINIQLFGWRSQAYLTAATGSGAVADGTTICGTTTFSICTGGVGFTQLAGTQTLTVSVNVSSAQFLNFSTVPITLVAAQGSGTCVVPISVSIYYTYGGTQYVASSAIRFYYGPGTGGTIFATSIQSTNVVLAAATTNTIYTDISIFSQSPLSASCLNQPLTWSSGANPTLGNGTFIISTTYKILSGLS